MWIDVCVKCTCLSLSVTRWWLSLSHTCSGCQKLEIKHTPKQSHMSHLTITPVGTLARKTDDIKSLTPVMQRREMCLICSEKGRRGSCHLQCNFTLLFLWIFLWIGLIRLIYLCYQRESEYVWGNMAELFQEFKDIHTRAYADTRIHHY